MKLKVPGNFIIYSVLIIILVWVFGRPLSAVGLLVYNFTGNYVTAVYKNIIRTQQDATDILASQKKLKKIQVQNTKLLMENAKLRSYVPKVEELQKQLRYKSILSFKTIPAQIIGRSPDTWHKQIIINKGSRHGVKRGKAVLTEAGIVGQVVKVSFYNSVAQLIYDKNFRIGAKLSRTGQYGVLNGNHPDPAFLEFITVGSDIKAGDKVVSSGISLNEKNPEYPENYPLGEVVDVARNPDALNLIVKVNLYEDLSSIKEVLILE